MVGDVVLRVGKVGFLVGGEGGSGVGHTHFRMGGFRLVVTDIIMVSRRVCDLGLMEVGDILVCVIHACEVEKCVRWLPSVAVVCFSS